MSDDADVAAIQHAIVRQSAELTPPPPAVEVRPLAEDRDRWGPRWDDIERDPQPYLPSWAAPYADVLCERARLSWTRLPSEALCHWDVRDDNILIRPDGTAVLVDWGMARLGPAWLDLMLLAIQAPAAEHADELLRRWLPADVQDAATDLILCLAGSQAWGTYQPPRPGIPTMGAFVADDARRLFAIALVRLGPYL
jgi:aminoglycoside phosphotransferase (APT) family kinase protein